MYVDRAPSLNVVEDDSVGECEDGESEWAVGDREACTREPETRRRRKRVRDDIVTVQQLGDEVNPAEEIEDPTSLGEVEKALELVPLDDENERKK